MSARGCPYNCAYCVNHMIHDIYKDSRNYLRHKSVDKVIYELKQIAKKYKIKSIYIQDDTFNMSTKRLREFSEKYSEKVNIPFECNLKADLCNDENMDYLKSANCTKAYIGIESGDEKFRRDMLHKYVSDESIINAFRLAKKCNIHTVSLNMIGLPLETPEQIEKTIELNKKVKPDSIQVSTFVPFINTDLYKFCEKNNLLSNKKIAISFYMGLYLKNPNLTDKQLKKYRRWFSYKCYEDRSKIKAICLLLRDFLIPYYLIYGKYLPLYAKKMIYYLFWNTKTFKFIGK